MREGDAGALDSCGRPAYPLFVSRYQLSHLDRLEAEGVHIIREAVAEAENPVILFSGGKDSAVVLHLALKAFWPARLPFPFMHVDTGHNFPEVISYRNQTVKRGGGSISSLLRSKRRSTKAGW